MQRHLVSFGVALLLLLNAVAARAGSCQDNSACAMSEVCDRGAGTCVIARPCTVDSDCQKQVCNRAVLLCEPAACAVDGDCFTGQVCNVDAKLCVDRERVIAYSGGCALAGGGGAAPSSGASLGLLLLGGLLLLRRRKRALWITSFFLVLGGGANEAAAQTSLNAVTFRPALGPEGLITVSGTQTPGHFSPMANVLFEYGYHPLRLTDRRALGMTTNPVDHLFNMHVGAGLGITRWLAVGVQVPLVLYQGFDPSSTTLDPSVVGPARSVGIGDVRLLGRGRLLSRRGFGLALLPELSLPTGHGDEFRGDDAVGLEGRLAADYRAPFGLIVAINAAFAYRSAAQEAFNVRVDSQVRYGAGVYVPFPATKGLGILGELSGAVSVTRLSASYGTHYTPLSGLLGLRYTHRSGLQVNLGGGGSFVSAPGEPLFRFFAGVGYLPIAPASRRARLESALREKAPPPALACPGGTLRRADGTCPELDQDGDGVLDKADRCPGKAGPTENGGCPDEDKDGDRIVDRLDRCPERAGSTENGGCPDLDGDGDGIVDRLDRCPDKAGPADEGGCPEADGDGDGVVDKADRCPDRAGVTDNGGCPDEDKDRDGIVDRLDKCPDKAGVKDQGGCPLIEVGEDAVKLLQPIRFAPKGVVPLPQSGPVLAALAKAVIEGGFKQVRIACGASLGKKVAGKRAKGLAAALIDAGLTKKQVKVTVDKESDEDEISEVELVKGKKGKKAKKAKKGQKGKKAKKDKKAKKAKR